MLQKKVSQWLQSIPPIKFLFLLALFLLAYAFITQKYLEHQQKNNINEIDSQIRSLIVKTSEQQLLPLLKSNQLEAISESIEIIIEHEILQTIAIYKSNGTLIDKVTKQTNPQPSHISKVVNLINEQQELGYLILEFSQPKATKTVNYNWLYYLVAALWGLAIILLLFRRKATEESSSHDLSKNEPPSDNYQQELQSLVRQGKKVSSSSTKLVIYSSFSTFDNELQKSLVSILNRWINQNQSYLLSFNSEMLTLSLSDSLASKDFKKIQILNNVLQKVGVDSTILVHNLDFGKSVYQHFFEVIKTGVWVEGKHRQKINNDQMAIKEDIELELEDYGDFHLFRIDALSATDAAYIERQSKLFLK